MKQEMINQKNKCFFIKVNLIKFNNINFNKKIYPYFHYYLCYIRFKFKIIKVNFLEYNFVISNLLQATNSLYSCYYYYSTVMCKFMADIPTFFRYIIIDSTKYLFIRGQMMKTNKNIFFTILIFSHISYYYINCLQLKVIHKYYYFTVNFILWD